MSIFARLHTPMFHLHGRAETLLIDYSATSEKTMPEIVPRFKPEPPEAPLLVGLGSLMLEDSYWDSGSPAPSEDDNYLG